MMLLLSIFFYFFPSGTFFSLPKGRKLGIGRLWLNYKGFFWWLREVSGGTFVAHTCLSKCFTFDPSYSNIAFLLKAPLFLLEFNPNANKGVWSCCESFCSLGPNFGLFKDHYFFAWFSSSKFILVMLRFFNGVWAKKKFGFFFKHVQVDIHPFGSPFSWWAFKHGIWTPLRFIWPRRFN